MEKWFELSNGIVMPAQCDIYGHMNVRYYAALFDDAGWHMPRMSGLSLEQIRAKGLGTVVATLTIDFLHEIRAGELFTIRGAVAKVGTKSFTYEMRLFATDSNTHCATQKIVEVCFDTKTRKGVALPEDVRARLQAVAHAQ
ncbi:MAG: acyl-CoA thioesterase [Betaproteobacteria bacterium]